MDNGTKIHLKMQPFAFGDWNFIVTQIQFVIEWFGIEHVHAHHEFTTLINCVLMLVSALIKLTVRSERQQLRQSA